MTHHESHTSQITTKLITTEKIASASKSDLLTFASPFLKYWQKVGSKKTPQKLLQSFFALHAKEVLGLFSIFFNQGDTC